MLNISRRVLYHADQCLRGLHPKCRLACKMMMITDEKKAENKKQKKRHIWKMRSHILYMLFANPRKKRSGHSVFLFFSPTSTKSKCFFISSSRWSPTSFSLIFILASLSSTTLIPRDFWSIYHISRPVSGK